MNKRIIINADDFGLCQGVNDAVLKAHTEGILTSTTIMANMPAANQAVEIAKKIPTLGVGVHLNLYEGPPVSKDPCVKCLLATDGQFKYSVARLSLLSLAIHKFRKAIETELAAQIQWVIDKGISPTHLDSHKHIHNFPAIFTIVCKLAKRFDISAVRHSYEPKQLSRSPWPLPRQGGKKEARLVRTMARINKIQDTGLLKTDALLGIAHTGKMDTNFLKAVTLYNTAATTEIMTHPGYPQGFDKCRTFLIKQRQHELDALCNEKSKKYFEDAKITLVHYGQL